MGFTLSLLLFFLLVRFVLPRVLRAVLGSFVRQQVHKAQQQGFGGFPPGYGPAGGPNFGGYQQHPPAGPPPAAAGQVRVDYVPEQPQHSEFRGGEYVDYEEVK